MAKKPKAIPVEEIKHQAVTPLYPPPVGMDEVIGQERGLELLQASMKSGRVHHAWIFHGPRGVGKFTTALSFAAALLDPSTAPDLSGKLAPDPESHVQRMLRVGSHPDLHVIVKELAKFHADADIRARKLTQIPLEVVRQHLLEPAAMAPQVKNEGRASKVFIIDEAELLNTATQNAVLKTMEEPEGRTVIILVTSSEDRLLPTIRSRCQRVPFVPLDAGQMKAWLKKAKPELPEADKEWLIAYADGSPGELISAATGGVHEWNRAIGPGIAAALKGEFTPGLGGQMAKLIDDWAAEYVEETENASKEAANRVAAARMFRLIAELVRRDVRARAPRAGATDPVIESRLNALDLVRKAEMYQDGNVQMQFVFEWLAAELASASS